jgi:hypothetical protein
MTDDEKPSELLARAQKAAEDERAALREKPKEPVQDTVLTGWRFADA